MNKPLRIGIIGDFDPNVLSHIATNEALSHSAGALAATLDPAWLPTRLLDSEDGESVLKTFDALWGAPGSPYKSMSGALRAIRFAREQGFPFIGTCGGFQHTVLEYARNVLGIRDAGHEEIVPGASRLVISKLACSPAGTTQKIKIVPGTLAHQAYGKEEVTEGFRCNYGLNPAYRTQIVNSELIVAGVDLDEEVSIVELAGHRFFLATLFLPQLSSSIERPPPLITAYLKAAQVFHACR